MITSAANPRLKLVRRLASRRQRHKLGLFVCEGEDLVAAAVEAGVDPVDVLVDAERPALTDELAGAEPVSPALLAEVSGLAHPPRVVAVFRIDDLPRLENAAAPSLGLALWRVGDPGNVGTLVRCADAFGPSFVSLSTGCADPVGPKTLRASMGALFRVPLARFDDAPGPWVALVPDGGTPLRHLDLGPRVTFVLGSERAGLAEEVLRRCDEIASIPISPGSESLNVAAAGAIALYEVSRRRQ